MTRRIRTAVLISGTGTNMMALVEAAKAVDYPADISLVVSNRPDAPGLDKAKGAGIDAIAIDHKQYTDRESFERALDEALQAAGIELVALAGFMRILTSWFVGRWAGRIVNIHPSLLPRHKGLDTHRRALEAGDDRHGASVHWVSEELDGGDVIDQQGFDVPPTATVESMIKHVRTIEHVLYPRALAKAAVQAEVQPDVQAGKPLPAGNPIP